MVTIVPRLTAAQAGDLARVHWGIEGVAHALPSSIDQNFRLDTAPTQCGEDRYVLKISNASELPGFLQAQVRALDFLAGMKPPTIPVPRVVRLPDGEAVVRSGAHLAWLVSWLEGTPIARLESRSAGLLRDVGRALGDLDARLAAFDDPAVHREFRWDLTRAPAILPLTVHIAEPAGRELVRRRLRRFERDTLPGLRDLPHQVVHNDANDHNLLVRATPGGPKNAPGTGGMTADPTGPGEPYEPCGVLDFGDLLWTPRAAEVAIAMTYAMLGPGEPVEAAAALLAGYRESLPLQPAELEVLPDLILARLCVSVTISAYERAREPENAFVTVSEAPAWGLLENLAGQPGSRLAEAFAEMA